MRLGKTLLINPRMCAPHSVRLPLSLLSLASVLEGKREYVFVDGNVDPDAEGTVINHLRQGDVDLLAVTVMPGPQVGPAIEISSAARHAFPKVPIAWGGYFPTLYPESAMNAPYVDYVVRGQGEDTLRELLDALPDAPGSLSSISGLTWKDSGIIVHNSDRQFRAPDQYPPLPYHRIPNVETYFRPSFMGDRTGVHQSAIGCRYRCTFCGVVSMFNGYTKLPAETLLERTLVILKDRYGANAMQFYDHNFFDRESNSIPVLEVMDKAQMPWWCYARADTLANFSTSTWELLRRSRFTMAYIGAEAASDEVLKSMRKGSRVEHTLEVARRCREYGVIPEFSFVLGGPEDPEGEIEKTFAFVKKLKTIHPECEVILYFYSPTPQRDPAYRRNDHVHARIPKLESYGPDGPELPTTPEEWTQPRWLNYVCHQDAPWLSRRIRQKVRDFARVLYCRFPTVQDYTTPKWGKALLRNMSRWRYSTDRYSNPWELNLAHKLVRLREPQRESL